jgi:hypothetical protein
MLYKNKWATMIVLVATILVVSRSGGWAETLLYYEEDVDQCYAVAGAYYRYAVHIDPNDFGVDTEFLITKIIASADIPTGLPVPVLISDAFPPDFQDSALYRQDIAFTDARWDTFDLAVPFAWKGDFWIQVIYTTWGFNPFSQSVPEDQARARRRNLVNLLGFWGPNECNMALGVIIETPAGVVECPSAIPEAFTLSQNYPNPFNPNTTIEFSLKKRQKVTLRIYDVRGRTVATLVDRVLGKGNHEVVWEGGDTPSGVYYYELRAGGKVLRRRMTLTK